LHRDLNRPILLVTDRADHALSLFDEMGFWVKSPRYHFAEPNPLFYEQAAWGVTTRRERLQTLTALASYHLPFAPKPEVPPIFVTSARSLMTRTMPPRLPESLPQAHRTVCPAGCLLRSWGDCINVNTVLEPPVSGGGIMDI
jgi:transcription-repair coupling factor (superfamily II helicase)